LPPGFTLETIATGQDPQKGITNFEFLPDGGMLTLGRDGKVTMVPEAGNVMSMAEAAGPYTVGTIPNVHAGGDMGALGLALAPDYQATGHFYTLYGVASGGGYALRLSRWTAVPPSRPTSLSTEQVILEMPKKRHVHAGGTVVVSGGSLYLSVGDDANYGGVDMDALR